MSRLRIEPGGRWQRLSHLRSVLLVLAVAFAALAQTASEKPNADVRRVAARIRCQCGCGDSVATCSMLECEFSKPAKLRIAQMQAVGMSDDQIIQAFIRQYGPGIYLARPNAFGWIVPYSAVGVGLLGIWLFIRKYRKPKPLAELGSMEIDDPALEKYKDQIEKDLANLE
jgi:cytochrome c-type biogenesis protein CcmH/NrfF